jgi:shikimate kinase
MKKRKSNIILIGMPGSGKSTVGVILAKLLAKRYLDTDILLQNLEKRSLQDIVDKDGHMAPRHPLPKSYHSYGRKRSLQ